MAKLPRGIRNNNPGNIRKDGTKWQGLKPVQDDPAFCQFLTPSDGIRALMKVLLSYYRKHNLDTVRKIINRWAPPVENNTNAYIATVCDDIGVLPDEVIDVEKTGILVALARSIVRHENGKPYAPWDLFWWYGMPIYVDAVNRAKGLK